ncbi:hypothetical protein CEXT_459591 [Caerostris extrusa]|uniref:Uncharacterized protein n=1 Tax=Caerostris extrusa TaxID=172846 RepID=A0AAV4QTD8_CAEEX|nr:hypothetical protein CEXT_459591 [Caerostris extrusa]
MASNGVPLQTSQVSAANSAENFPPLSALSSPRNKQLPPLTWHFRLLHFVLRHALQSQPPMSVFFLVRVTISIGIYRVQWCPK